jgi:hypothetical protein
VNVLRVCFTGDAPHLDAVALPTPAGDGASLLARLAFGEMHGTFHACGRRHELDTGEPAGASDAGSDLASDTRSLM